MSSVRELEAIFRGALEQLDPARRVRETLTTAGLGARLGTGLGDGPVTLIAAGKAAHAMATGAAEVLGNRIERGLVVAPTAGTATPPITTMVAAHPTPDERSVAAGRAMIELVRASSSQVIALVSGGASALIAVPAPGLSLADKVAVTRAVYQGGAPIGELNAVRKHVSAIKGGRLAAAAAHAAVLTLVSSDVVGDELAAVGSGPTLPDQSTFADACRIVETRCGWGAVPRSVRAHLEAGARGQREETPSDPRPGDAVLLVAGLEVLAGEAARFAERLGMRAEMCGPPLSEDIESIAARIVARARSASDVCLVFGGEATIRLPARPGVGGRAQHLALELAERLRGTRGVTVLVCGSDGIDGNSPAAGAIVDGDTWQHIADTWGAPRSALDRYDSHSALSAVGATVTTGPTGVNHADLVLVRVHGEW